MAERWLLADLGATNTRVGLADHAGLIPGSARRYANRGFSGLVPLLSTYLDAADPRAITALCLGVAGPVRGGTAQLSNRDWFIDSADLRAATGAGTILMINDLQAQGHALDDLPEASVTPLFSGAPTPAGATRMVLGLGTGCNIAVVHRIGAALHVPPSEIGQSALPHCGAPLDRLIAHLGRAHPHKPVEAAVSGPGLRNIWQWLGGGADETSEAILAAAARGDARAVQTMTHFCDLLGRVAGDIALAHLPMGGLYLIGGTARAIAPHLAQSSFLTRFSARGPYAEILRAIPVFLIEDDNAALRGCARCLRQALNR